MEFCDIIVSDYDLEQISFYMNIYDLNFADTKDNFLKSSSYKRANIIK